MIIRPETDADTEAIAEVTKAAFENHPISQQTEHFIIAALRAANALTISLVAEVDRRVVGHVALSPITISDGSEDWYGLGPISVLPEYQTRGIGKALMHEGLSRLKALGAKGCALVGDPDYYERFGFRSVPELTQEGVPQRNLLVLPFGESRPQGIVEFHPGFLATG
ncbi:MAG: N-acetyltransferase [Armatimonadota bacterium]|nr:MAG: N-acetyltransferase [Armatimonadota bacterium]